MEVDVDQEVRLLRVWCAADAGLVINPDGARNQLEGGIVQAASMTLKEQVRMEGDGITSLDWAGYPILRFSEVPEIDTEIIHAPDLPTLGMGECYVRADRGSDRQRGRACAGHAHPGHAVHPRAHRGGVAEVAGAYTSPSATVWGKITSLLAYAFTSGQPPSASGRHAWSGGIVTTSLQ